MSSDNVTDTGTDTYASLTGNLLTSNPTGG